MKRRERRHTLEVVYKGGMNIFKDRAIVKLVGRPEDGSGYCFADGSRDLLFGFVVRSAAERAMERVRAAMRGRHVRCRIFTE